MPRFHRTRPAPTVQGGYQSYRPYVRRDFEETCAYCVLGELYAAGPENFELDHFRPQSKFPDLAQDFYNLYYACHPCNHMKRDHWPPQPLQDRGYYLVDLCKDDFEQHFRVQPTGVWIGLTPAAQYTVDLLRLNRRHLIEVRLLLRSLAAPE